MRARGRHWMSSSVVLYLIFETGSHPEPRNLLIVSTGWPVSPSNQVFLLLWQIIWAEPPLSLALWVLLHFLVPGVKIELFIISFLSGLRLRCFEITFFFSILCLMTNIKWLGCTNQFYLQVDGKQRSVWKLECPLRFCVVCPQNTITWEFLGSCGKPSHVNPFLTWRENAGLGMPTWDISLNN